MPTGRSYSRIVGANDRLQIGCGRHAAGTRCSRFRGILRVFCSRRGVAQPGSAPALGQEPADSRPAFHVILGISSDNSNSLQQVIRHESPHAAAAHHQESHAECHRSWQWRRNSGRCHRRRHCGRRQSPDRDVQTVHERHQALIVLHHLDGGIVRDDTEVPLPVELNSPWRLSLNNLAMARRTGRSPHLPNHCRVIRGGFKSGARNQH